MSIRQVILSEIVTGNNRDLELKPTTEEVYLNDAIPFAPTILITSLDATSLNICFY